MTHDVFISHSSLDKLPADAVCHGLEAKGIRCWMAPRDQIAGKPYGEQISEAIHGARVMVLVFSEHVNRSQAVLNEINVAADANVTIVPFRIASVEFNRELRYYLGRTHWLDAFPQPVEAYIEALANTVQRNLPAAPEPAPAATQSPSSPQASSSPQPPSSPQLSATPPPAAGGHAPQHVNRTAVIVLGMVLLFVLLVVFAGVSRKPSAAQDQAAKVVAQAVANAIQAGEADDRESSSHPPPPPATPKPAQDVPY